MNKEIKIATRQSYGEALLELGKENENVVVLDADLSSATKTELLQKNLKIGFLIWELQNKTCFQLQQV